MRQVFEVRYAFEHRDFGFKGIGGSLVVAKDHAEAFEALKKLKFILTHLGTSLALENNQIVAKVFVWSTDKFYIKGVIVKKSKKSKNQTKPMVEMLLLDNIAQESHGIPTALANRAKNADFVFVHKYPNLDRVLMGLDLIARSKVHAVHSEGALAVASKGLKQGHYIFVGVPGLKGVGKGFVERIENGVAYISGMGIELEK